MRQVPVSRLAPFGTTIFTEMTRLANEHGAVNLAQGFPDFAGPDFAKDAACDAIRADLNQYARMQGAVPLVDAVADTVERRTGLRYDPLREVTVFAGATEGIHCALMALVEPGDEVVLFEPYYDSYRACVAMAGATPRCVTLRAPDFRFDQDELAAAFTPRTRLVLVNTPHNPTGRVFTRDELTQIARLCIAHDAICLTDEVYERLVYEGEHVAMATLPGMRERTVTMNSTGKTFSLTGWKIGWATAPPELSRALATAHQFVTFAVATPFQHAMAAALRAPDAYFTSFLAGYRERRDFLVAALTECGFGVRAPQGAYFVLADIRPLGWDDDVAFCRHLVEKVGVAAIPPTAFYETKSEGRFLVRFAFCKRRETLEAGIARLRRGPLERGQRQPSSVKSS
jgi:N-succinyldiaminopimelate aminotransferase